LENRTETSATFGDGIEFTEERFVRTEKAKDFRCFLLEKVVLRLKRNRDEMALYLLLELLELLLSARISVPARLPGLLITDKASEMLPHADAIGLVWVSCLLTKEGKVRTEASGEEIAGTK
jgi:hypothetical protein